jgi:predicted permease
MHRLLTKLRLRARTLVQRDRVERDLDAELDFYFDAEMERHLARGLSRAEARAAAARSVGPSAHIKDECRDALGVRLLDELSQDVRYACRGLRKTPGFVFVAVMTLALGIGANAAVFSAVHALLLRPFPFPDADRLVRINSVRGGADGPLSVPEQDDLASLTRVVDRIALYTDQGMYNASGDGQAEELQATITTHNLFDVLGVHPILGASFPAEYDRVRHFGVVISYGLWQRRFGGDPDIFKRTLTLDGAAGYEIFGVMPRDFNFPMNSDLFRSAGIAPDPASYRRRDLRTHMAIARLAHGVSVDQAQREVDRLADRLARDYPATNSGLTFRVMPLRDLYVRHARGYLWLVSAAVALVLLLAAVNVASLTLARGLAKQRDLVVRLALGATRARLVRQSIVESMVLVGAGAVAGAFLARACISALNGLTSLALPPWMRIHLDLPVLIGLLGFSLIAGVIVAVVPVVRSRDMNAERGLREDGRGAAGSARHERMRGWFVVTEMALAVALVASAGAVVQSVRRLQSVDLGFRPRGLLTFRVELGWRTYNTTDKIIAFDERALERLTQLPGVHHAALDSNLPISGKAREPYAVAVDDQAPYQRRANPYVNAHTVDADYFATLSIPLVRGRVFSASDRATSQQVAIVSRGFADRMWPGKDPIGHRVLVGNESADNPWATIIGVVHDTRHARVDAVGFDVYRPHRQRPTGGRWFIVQGTQEPMSLAREATRVITSLDVNQSFFDVQPMDERVDAAIWQERMAGTLVTAFGSIASVLAVIGVTGLIAYLIRQREREISVRMILGASRRDVITLFVKRAAGVVATGLLAGLFVACWGIAFMSHVLFETSFSDVLVSLVVPVLLSFVALGASGICAWRGTHVDPAIALRQ